MTLDQRTVLGQVGDVEHARRLYLALQNGGVEQGDIRFGGETAREAQRETERAAGKETVDERLVHHVAGRAVQGALVGALLGVSLGVVLGLFALLVVSSVQWWGVGICAAVFGALGGVLGAFISAERGMGVDEELQLGFADVEGPIWIAVRIRDDANAERVRTLFRGNGVSLLEEHDARRRGIHLVDW
jgi:hypothetical protein